MATARNWVLGIPIPLTIVWPDLEEQTCHYKTVTFQSKGRTMTFYFPTESLQGVEVGDSIVIYVGFSKETPDT